MRARTPDQEGYVERDGVRLWYEVHGDGGPTVLLIPGWSLPTRAWKAQVPYLARHFRVIAYDPRGTGRSDRPLGTDAYALSEHTADAVAVMDVVGARSVVAFGKSRGAQTALALAAELPARVEGVIVAAPFVPLSPWPPLALVWSGFDEPSANRRRRAAVRMALTSVRQVVRSRDLRLFTRRVDLMEAADRFSRQGMHDDFDGFARWFVTQIVATDPHSTKQIDDLVGWMLETGPQAAADAMAADCVRGFAGARELCESVSCPVLVIHGDEDLTVPFEWGTRVADLMGAQLFVVPGAGHLPGGRYPVVVNLAVREFVESLKSRGARPAPDQTEAAR